MVCPTLVDFEAETYWLGHLHISWLHHIVKLLLGQSVHQDIHELLLLKMVRHNLEGFLLCTISMGMFWKTCSR
jgi:hypothetical protein